jgi:hypothetical protein
VKWLCCLCYCHTNAATTETALSQTNETQPTTSTASIIRINSKPYCHYCTVSFKDIFWIFFLLTCILRLPVTVRVIQGFVYNICNRNNTQENKLEAQHLPSYILSVVATCYQGEVVERQESAIAGPYCCYTIIHCTMYMPTQSIVVKENPLPARRKNKSGKGMPPRSVLLLSRRSATPGIFMLVVLLLGQVVSYPLASAGSAFVCSTAHQNKRRQHKQEAAAVAPHRQLQVALDPLAEGYSAVPPTAAANKVLKKKELQPFTRYLEVESWKRPDLRGIEPVLLSVATACKLINRIVQRAQTDDVYGVAVDERGNPLDQPNVQGEVQQKLDVLCNQIMLTAFCGSSTGQIHAAASEEEDVPRCCSDVMVRIFCIYGCCAFGIFRRAFYLATSRCLLFVSLAGGGQSNVLPVSGFVCGDFYRFTHLFSPPVLFLYGVLCSTILPLPKASSWPSLTPLTGPRTSMPAYRWGPSLVSTDVSQHLNGPTTERLRKNRSCWMARILLLQVTACTRTLFFFLFRCLYLCVCVRVWHFSFEF